MSAAADVTLGKGIVAGAQAERGGRQGGAARAPPRLRGQSGGAAVGGRDPVNQAMIRHWVDAMGDDNPVYVDEDAARANGFPGVIAPPTMLQAWVMRGYRSYVNGAWTASEEGVSVPSAQEQLFALLDEAGFTSVVATNCDQEYARPLALGDRLTVSSVIDSVSPEKHTGLGDGHFVTTRQDFTDQHGAVVATMRFRILRFRPALPWARDDGRRRRPTRAPPATATGHHPGQRILLRGCPGGQAARPALCVVRRAAPSPRPACPTCHALEWDTIEASGRADVYSFVVVHHPQVPAFDYPLPIAVVELEEGTRLVADLVGVDPDDVHIGMPVVVEFVAVDDELTLPMFRPDAAPHGAAGATPTPHTGAAR